MLRNLVSPPSLHKHKLNYRTNLSVFWSRPNKSLFEQIFHRVSAIIFCYFPHFDMEEDYNTTYIKAVGDKNKTVYFTPLYKWSACSSVCPSKGLEIVLASITAPLFPLQSYYYSCWKRLSVHSIEQPRLPLLVCLACTKARASFNPTFLFQHQTRSFEFSSDMFDWKVYLFTLHFEDYFAVKKWKFETI